MADLTLADVMREIAALRADVARAMAALVDVRSLSRETLSQELQMANVLDSITATVASLVTEVTNETTVNQSAITLITGIAAQVASLATQLQTAITNAADPAQVAAVATQLTTLASTVNGNATALAAAVTANTPQASGAPSARTP